MKLKHCPKCKIIALPYNNFCFQCGNGLVERPDDPKCKCGSEMSDGFNFCQNCGRPREEEVETSGSAQKEADVKVFKSKAGPRGRHGEDIPRGLDSDDKEKH